MSCKRALNFLTNEKHFAKTISQWELDYGLFTNLPKIAKYLISVAAPLIQHQPGYLYKGAVSKFQLFLKKNIQNCDFSENHRINLFAANAPFFYPLKTSENLKVF